MKKYNTENIENILTDLKNKKTIAPSSDFTGSVMSRIHKFEAEKDSPVKYDEYNIEKLLLDIDTVEVKPSNNFTLSVMDKIKSEQKEVYNAENIEPLLYTLKDRDIVKPADDFTMKVIDKIREDENDTVGAFNSIYKKFLIGSAIVAAAAVLLALDLFSSYDPGMAEYMVTDFFNVGIY